MLLKLFVVLCLFQIEKIVCEECPSEVITPCRCVAYPNGLTVECLDDKIENLHSALDVFSKNSIYVTRIYITNKKIKELPGHFFGNATIGEVTLFTPRLSKVNPGVFEGQENSLYDVLFTDTDLIEVPAGSMNILARLKAFRYSNTEETKAIRGSIFKNQVNTKSVETLFFGFNGIESIERGAFAPLTNLKTVTLYQNPLKTIDPASFPPAINRIVLLEIMKGALETIPRKVLASLPDYSQVTLSDNEIKILGKEDITLLINKKIDIDLQGNKLNCDCDFLLFVNAPIKLWKGNCATPKQRSNISLLLLKATDFPDCPKKI